MTRIHSTLAAGAFALAAASAAFAQPAPMSGAAATPDAASSQPMADQAPSAGAAGVNTSATDAPQGVETIVQGNNTLVTNGPIPDTPANRAKYGQPMSMTGKRTKPAGN